MTRNLFVRISGVLFIACASGLIVGRAAALRTISPAHKVEGDPAETLKVSSVLTSSIYLPIIGREWVPDSYPNCRLGIGSGGQSGYATAVSNLRMGWYLDWTATSTPAQPNHSEFLQQVRFKPDFGGYSVYPNTATIHSIITANPGATWLLGNEPDSPFQDNLTPEVYAQAYHDLYQFIKNDDPSAKIGAGGIVQPTPLRLEYLDRVLAAYQSSYGQALPADLWNIHSYILREIVPTDPLAQPPTSLAVWGAYVPPGLSETHGQLYNYSDMFSSALFKQRLIDFRTWMNDHGYRQQALYITEFGTLFPYPPYIDPPPYVDENGVAMDEARTIEFLKASFDVLANLTDTNLGDSFDANRLVQRWAWYSLADPNFGGPLFDPATKARRPLGDAFADYAQAIPPSIDFVADSAQGDPITAPLITQTVTATLHLVFSNSGNTAPTQPFAVTFWDAPPGTGSIISSTLIAAREPSGCGGMYEATVQWTNLPAGSHLFYAEVDSAHVIAESDESNNVIAGQVLVAAHPAWLPVVLR